MVQKNSCKRLLIDFNKKPVRILGIEVLFSELLSIGLFLLLASCGNGEKPKPYTYGNSWQSYIEQIEAQQREQDRLNSEEEKQRRKLAAAERIYEQEQERVQEADFKASKEWTERTRVLTSTPETLFIRNIEKKTLQHEITDSTKTTQDYYVKGRRKSENLNSLNEAQVILVGNSHLLPFAETKEEKDMSDEVQLRLEITQRERLRDNAFFSDLGEFSESILLVEGESYEVELEELEDFRIVENEIFKDPNNKITRIMGWENSIALKSIDKIFSWVSTIREENEDLLRYLKYNIYEFSILQKRNYYMFQNIVKTLQKYPNARIIVTSGTCHTACEETLFDLLDGTNIRYTTFESKEALLGVADYTNIEDDLYDNIYPYNIEKTKIASLRQSLRAKFSKSVFTSTSKSLDFYFGISAKYQEAIEFLEHEKHFLEFFWWQAYLPRPTTYN